MKIQVIDSSTNQTLENTTVQLQVKGKDSGFLSLKTDSSGFLTLDDKYKGQQITPTINGSSGSSITAAEGAKLKIEQKTKEKFK